MVKIHIIIFLLGLCFGSDAQTNEMQYFTDLDLALDVAKKNDKGVIVYVGRGVSVGEKSIDYLFKDESLRNFITERFVPVRARKMTNKKFDKSYYFSKYPMFIFYDKEGEELYSVTKGGIKFTKTAIIELVEFALTRPFPRMEFYKKAFRKNKKNASFLEEYFLLALELRNHDVLEKIDKQYGKIYVNEPKDEWLDFVFENTYTEKSELFEILIEHKRDFEKRFGEGKVQTRILKRLLFKIKVNSPGIELDNFIRKFIDKINNYDIVIQDKYLMSVIAYRKYSRSNWGYKIKKDKGRFATKIINSYSEALNNYIMMSALWEIAYYVEDQSQLEKSLLQLESLIEEEDSYWRLDCKSVFLYKLGKEKEANEYVENARTKASALHKAFESTILKWKRKGYLK